MTVEIKPETERLIQEEISRGEVRSVDELILYAVQALREKRHEPLARTEPSREPRRNLYELLSQPPFAGSQLDLERQKDYPRPLDL